MSISDKDASHEKVKEHADEMRTNIPYLLLFWKGFQ